MKNKNSNNAFMSLVMDLKLPEQEFKTWDHVDEFYAKYLEAVESNKDILNDPRFTTNLHNDVVPWEIVSEILNSHEVEKEELPRPYEGVDISDNFRLWGICPDEFDPRYKGGSRPGMFLQRFHFVMNQNIQSPVGRLYEFDDERIPPIFFGDNSSLLADYFMGKKIKFFERYKCVGAKDLHDKLILGQETQATP